MKGKELLTFLREIEDTNPDLLEKDISVISREDPEDSVFLYDAHIKTARLNDEYEFEDIEPEIVLVSQYNL